MRKPSPFTVNFMVFLLMTTIALIVGGLLLQTLTNIERSVETRTKARESATGPEIIINTTPSNPVEDEQLTVNFQINTNGMNIDGIEMRNMTVTDNGAGITDLPTNLTQVSSSLNPLVNSISPLVDNLSSISYVALLSSFDVPFNTVSQFQTFASMSLTPSNPGTIDLAFNLADTIVTEYGGAGFNVLEPPSNVTLTVAEAGEGGNEGDDGSDNGDGGQGGVTPDDSEDDECRVPYAPAVITAATGANSGEIEVSWVRPGDHEYFAVSFGKESGRYVWGDINIGNVRGFTIRFLDPGIRYYIVVSAVNACGASAYSPEVSAVAAGTIDDNEAILEQKPEVVVLESTPEPQAAATPSATPTVAAPTITDDQEVEEEQAGLLDIIKDNRWWVIGIVLVVGFGLKALFGRKKPPTLQAATGTESMTEGDVPIQNPAISAPSPTQPPMAHGQPVAKQDNQSQPVNTTPPQWGGTENNSPKDIS